MFNKIILFMVLLLVSLLCVGAVFASPDASNSIGENVTLNESSSVDWVDGGVDCQDDLLSSSGDDLGIHFVHEGVKVYGLNGEYNVKLVDRNNNPVTSGEVSFFINDFVFSRVPVGGDGVASCLLPVYGNVSVVSYYSNSVSTCCDLEDITVGVPSVASLDQSTWGANFNRGWSDMKYDLCSDGYHALIDNNTYHWIKFNGERYIVHKQRIVDEEEFVKFFMSLSKSVSWDIIEIDLLNKTYSPDCSVFSDKEWDYYSRLTYGQLIIHGNGATLSTNGDFNFMFVGSQANVVIENLTISKFQHCFINQGFVLCNSIRFIDNYACKFDVGIGGSGSVIHNYNVAEFHDCDFVDNLEKACGGMYSLC